MSNTLRSAQPLANSCKWCGNALAFGDLHPACKTADASYHRARRDEQRVESALADAAEYELDAEHDAALIGGDEPRDAYEPAIRYWGAEVQP